MALPVPYPAETQAKGWRFELDYEQIDQSDTWDLAAEIAMAQPALLMMWLVAWRQKPCGSLPADESVIRSKCRIPPAVWAKCREVCMRGWWTAEDGRLYHDTIVKRVLAMLDKRASDAQRAAKRRALKADSGVSGGGITDESRVTHAGPTREFDTKHQAPSTKEYPPTPLDEIVELYHAKLPTLPRVVLKTAKRDKACRLFWRWIFDSPRSDGQPRAATADQALTWISGYFDRAAANDFLLGNRPGKGHENWRADFDFLLTERGRKHVIERTVDA